MIIVKEIISDLVAEVSTELTATLQAYDPTITGVHYMNGHPLEITNRLTERDNDAVFKWKKYPLVALFMDFPETMGQDIGLMKVKLHIMIARATSQILVTDQRYEQNFFPVLYPIYDALMTKFHTFSYGRNGKPFETIEPAQIKHTKIDRPFWGRETFLKNEANTFNDYLDAIEIRDLELLINLNFKKQC